MIEIVQKLRLKYSTDIVSNEFSTALNVEINKFYAKQKNVDQFFHWLKKTEEKLDLNLQHMVSTFFPSLSFSITYEIDNYKDYRIHKEEIFCISFIEECYTTVYTSYIRDNKSGSVLRYRPNSMPERDSEYDDIYNRIVEEIKIKYPKKIYLENRYLNCVLGNLNLTFSRNTKTRLFEVLFRDKVY